MDEVLLVVVNINEILPFEDCKTLPLFVGYTNLSRIPFVSGS